MVTLYMGAVPDHSQIRFYNATFVIDIPTTSPMFDFELEDPSLLPAGKDLWTGTGNKTFTLSYVGLEYMLNGTAEWSTVVPNADNTSDFLVKNDCLQAFPGSKSMRTVTVGPGDTLGSMSDVELSSVIVQVKAGRGAKLHFSGATVRIPIRTQA